MWWWFWWRFGLCILLDNQFAQIGWNIANLIAIF